MLTRHEAKSPAFEPEEGGILGNTTGPSCPVFHRVRFVVHSDDAAARVVVRVGVLQRGHFLACVPLGDQLLQQQRVVLPLTRNLRDRLDL